MKKSAFQLVSDFAPAGDQPAAIRQLVNGLNQGDKQQTLLGVTGSGKTFTLANVVAEVNRPALVISHNKTLAAQLYSELKNFFPHNAVEYFVSYYDYYQPEAYIPATDTYIAKDSSINEEIERLRLAATSSLLERRDVIIVASVSCIYGLGSPEDVKAMQIDVAKGRTLRREDLLRRLVDMQYQRNDIAPERGCFRAAGDTVDIFLSYREDAVRVEFWGDEVERLTRRDPLTNHVTGEMDELVIFPAKHFAMPYERIERAEKAILEELDQVVRDFQNTGKLVEAQRIHQRTMYDLEMLREVGFCSGIENYSRHLAGRPPGSEPYTLLDFFPDDFVTIIDESHVTIPQISGMFKADRSRKSTLVEHGFRLPSALDNRPLNFEEFCHKTGQTLFASATPAAYELERTTPVELVVRPTGLLDPKIIVRPLEHQIDDFIEEVRLCAEAGERVLCTTLTKRTAEDLSEYLRRLDLRVRYLHSEVNALERVEIIRDLRKGEFDCLVGINLLREGLDLPEVALVAILDADKEGFLRSETSLIQTAGRAARHVDGRVILYADTMTKSIRRMMAITEHRREKQQAFNAEHNITPRSVIRAIEDSLRVFARAEDVVERVVAEEPGGYATAESVRLLEEDMRNAADALEFERAAMIRDQIYQIKKKLES
ncbi:MAG: excinuclease ABC subunit UvrB [Lentisphaeria bacterium]|nr:excinuclease ABC subunit UvrB [Lentisphaeria bacterium]